MVAVWDGVVLGNLCIGIFIIWRLFQIQERLDLKISEIDKSLGVVVGLIIEKIENIQSQVPDINLINQNPFGQIIDFLKSRDPNNPSIKSQPTPNEIEPEFIEVESYGTKEIKTEKT